MMRAIASPGLAQWVAAGAGLLGLALGASGCVLFRDIASRTFAVMAARHPGDPARLQTPPGITAVCARGTVAYVLDAGEGVVLIDTGYDESGAALRRAIGTRKVLAIFQTHAHVDHRAATHGFRAPVIIGAADRGYYLENRRNIGLTEYAAIWPRLGEVVMGRPPRPAQLIEARHGDRFSVGNLVIQAVALPGHTPGSVAWRMGRVLFTGDAVQSPGGDAVNPAPALVTEDPAQAFASYRRLLSLDVDTFYDAHYGRIDDPLPKVRAALRRAEKLGPRSVPYDARQGCAEPRPR